MAKKFQTYVHVTNPETGETSQFEPGDECPSELEQYVDPAHFESEEDKAKSQQKQSANYDGMKKDELADLCAERDLEFEGTKAELIARLEASDAANG